MLQCCHAVCAPSRQITIQADWLVGDVVLAVAQKLEADQRAYNLDLWHHEFELHVDFIDQDNLHWPTS